MTTRAVSRILQSFTTTEGAGFLVHRPFPTRDVDMLDPFLLLDEMGPFDAAPGKAVGAPDHPHRGFETVTYMLEGEMEHRDSAGHSGSIGPGDVQWMTAGSGVVHSEMPGERIMRDGGRVHGFQLWVNLPKRDKMMAPRYQEITADRIPTVSSHHGEVTVRIIAGEALARKAVIETRTPILYLHFAVAPGGRVEQRIPSEYNVFLYVYQGTAMIDGRETAARGEAVVFDKDGAKVVFSNPGEDPLGALLIGGAPLREPVARYGPFVMNYKAEILQAIEDYQSGRMGKIDVDEQMTGDR